METELQNRGPEEVVVELKRTLKKWEKSFISEHGRTPSREDVQKASPEIQDIYQKYLQAKKTRSAWQQCVTATTPRDIEEKVVHNEKMNGKVQDTEAGIFGTGLNKKQSKKIVSSDRVQAKTWKLPPVSGGTGSRPKTWKSLPRINASHRPAPLVRKELSVENSIPNPSEVRNDQSSTSSVSHSVLPQSQSHRQLKYGGVSLAMLEKCDVNSAKLTQGQDNMNGMKQVKQSMGGRGISRKDSCLAHILGNTDAKNQSRDIEEEGCYSNGQSLECSQLDHESNATKESPRVKDLVPDISTADPLPAGLNENITNKDEENMFTDSLILSEEADLDVTCDHTHSAVNLESHKVDEQSSQRQTSDRLPPHDADASDRLLPHDADASDRLPPHDADADVQDNEHTPGTHESSESEHERHEPCKVGGGVSKKSGRSTAVSENFMKLNMKVKRYSRRPGRGLTGERYKRMEWKKRQRQVDGSSCGRGRGGAKFVCFKCGEVGHWARNCKGKAGFASLGSFDGETVEYSELTADEQMDLAALEELEKESPYPTIEEALQMAAGEKVERRMITDNGEGNKEGDMEVSEKLQHTSRCVLESDDRYPVHPNDTENHICPTTVEPLFHWEAGTSEPTPSCVLEALEVLGFSSFRPCQREVMMRILSGRSTLMITATGSGKSLCYQLPAYLYRKMGRGTCFTLVVSPLVSLMDDQVLRLPPGLKGACLHTNKTVLQREKVLQELAKGKVDILYLSPEALVGGVLWSGRRKSGGVCALNDLPPIAFACIDEVHCISEWSHNFRPSYLRLHKTLQECLGVHCILGLTATATHMTGLGVAKQLGVADQDVVWGAAMPNNLVISVSRDEDRDLALVELLSHEPYRSLDSIIIYCTRQQTTEGVAQMVRTSLQSWNRNETIKLSEPDCLEEPESVDDQNSAAKKTTKKRKGGQCYGKGKKRRSGAVVVAECYHAGMSASQRRAVQNRFMRGDLRIVVATVAFGMGLDKCDVRAVIHYNMPQSLEAYVQEVGRAGRDGNPAYCHTFIDQEARDLTEMRRNIYSDFVDSYSLKKFVEKIFPISSVVCTNMDVTVDIEEAVESLDVTKECLETLLCYLELSGKVRLKGVVKDACTVKCYGGGQQVKQLSWKVPAMAAAVATLTQKGVALGDGKQISFSITEVSRSMGQDRAIVRSELLGLQVNDRGTSRASGSGRSSVVVELEGLAFHLVVPGNLTCEKKEEAIEFLREKIKYQETLALEKLHLLHSILKQASRETQDECISDNNINSYLIESIQQYFSVDSLSTSDLVQRGIPVTTSTHHILPDEEELIGRDVRVLVSRFSSEQFSGRSIARIFHGISSPRYPAIVWGMQRGFWRKYLHLDFHSLCKVTTSHLIQTD